MDKLDQQILRILALEGNITNSKLAKRVGLSESATLERVRRLEAANIINGYVAKIDPYKVDRGLEIMMMLVLKNQNAEQIHEFEKAMANMDEVLSCAQLLGRFDFIAHIAVKDIPSLQRFIERLISLGCIDRMESLTVLKMIKRNHPAIPIEKGE
jgi:Lrp/AsnC family leucine-responsive transcriptional regulator